MRNSEGEQLAATTAPVCGAQEPGEAERWYVFWGCRPGLRPLATGPFPREEAEWIAAQGNTELVRAGREGCTLHRRALGLIPKLGRKTESATAHADSPASQQETLH